MLRTGKSDLLFVEVSSDLFYNKKKNCGQHFCISCGRKEGIL